MHIISDYLVLFVVFLSCSALCFYLPGWRLHQRGQVRELLADRDCIIERWAVPRASQGVGQQSGEKDGYSMAKLAS